MSLNKVIITMLVFFGFAFAEDSVVSAGYLKFPKEVLMNGGVVYQVMCVDGYKFLVVSRSSDSASVIQMRETNSSGNEKLMTCTLESK